MKFFFLWAELPVKCDCFVFVADWLDNVYLPTSLKRMEEAYCLMETKCRDLEVPLYKTQASFFGWADFGKVIIIRINSCSGYACSVIGFKFSEYFQSVFRPSVPSKRGRRSST